MGIHFSFMSFYPAVVLAALCGGLRAGLLATALSALLANYFWMEPVGQFALDQPTDWLALGFFLLSGALISIVTEAMHRAQARAHEAEMKSQVAGEREQATRAQRESEERLRTVLQSSRMGTFEIDLQSGEGEWNDVEFELLGLKPGEAPSNPESFFRHVHPDDVALVTAQWEEALRTGELDIECRIVRADGEERWLAGKGRFAFENGVPGRALRFMGVNFDITDRKRAELELVEIRQRLQAIMEAVPVGISYSDDPTCRNITGNPAVLAQFEITPQDNLSASALDNDAPGRQVRFFRKGVMISDAELPLQRAVAENRVIAPMELEIEMPSGRRWFAEASGAPIRNRDGSVLGGVAVTVDITERVRLEESLQQYSEMLESRVAERTAELREKDRLLLQQSRLAAMGEMVNNIAHQWRQPLNVLGLNIQRLPLFYDTDSFSKEFLDTTTRDAMKLIQHMSQTINDFRDFFKPDKEKIDFCINKAIRQTLNLVDDSFKHYQIQVITDIDGDAWANGYPNEFSQALLNILQNAREALLECERAERRVTIASSVENGRTVITIADNAGGIPEDIADRIYEPYFSTKGVQGTGIGLYMSKIIIEKNMGGSLTVRNVEGGAEFRIEV
jgi:PAS domain S-box-containing protein